MHLVITGLSRIQHFSEVNVHLGLVFEWCFRCFFDFSDVDQIERLVFLNFSVNKQTTTMTSTQEKYDNFSAIAKGL